MNGDGETLVVEWDRIQSVLVLNALAELPFKTVFETIGRINEQAHEGLREGQDERTRRRFRLSRQDVRLCLDAVQSLPYGTIRETASGLESLVGSFDGNGPGA